ncbi:MAG: thiamine pyrophosphate-dependent enzyme [Polyangiales bacterium]
MPTVLLVSHRGKPGEKDEPQHERMGQITEELIKLCGIEGHYFSDDGFASSLKDVLGRGVPAGWVFPKDCLTGGPKAPPVELHVETSTAATPPRAKYSPEVSREEALRLLLPVLNGKDAPAVVSTTGKMSRELYELDDQDHTKANRFYMVGSMGCAASFSLGIARARQGKVLCLDGDGALLMKLGTLATVGLTKQKNFHHVVLDNGAHESTGGQLTASPGMDTALIARVRLQIGRHRVHPGRHAQDPRGADGVGQPDAAPCPREIGGPQGPRTPEAEPARRVHPVPRLARGEPLRRSAWRRPTKR